MAAHSRKKLLYSVPPPDTYTPRAFALFVIVFVVTLSCDRECPVLRQISCLESAGGRASSMSEPPPDGGGPPPASDNNPIPTQRGYRTRAAALLSAPPSSTSTVPVGQTHDSAFWQCDTLQPWRSYGHDSPCAINANCESSPHHLKYT